MRRCSLLRFLHKRRNDFLGYLGERAVAENLDAVREKGYRIFHDVPANGRTTNFNVNHVVVGPTGIAIIETKTAGSAERKEGRKSHEVVFDGQRLLWPWGQDACGCDQVVAQADWLRKWIEQRTALRIDPKPFLDLPGLVCQRTRGR